MKIRSVVYGVCPGQGAIWNGREGGEVGDEKSTSIAQSKEISQQTNERDNDSDGADPGGSGLVSVPARVAVLGLPALRQAHVDGHGCAAAVLSALDGYHRRGA